VLFNQLVVQEVLSRLRVDSSARNAVLRKEKYRNEMRVRCCHVNCQRENGAEVVVVAVVQAVAFREL
jgi:hypothetical protein